MGIIEYKKETFCNVPILINKHSIDSLICINYLKEILDRYNITYSFHLVSNFEDLKKAIMKEVKMLYLKTKNIVIALLLNLGVCTNLYEQLNLDKIRFFVFDSSSLIHLLDIFYLITINLEFKKS